MTDRSEDCPHRDLDPSLESQFGASTVTRRLARTEWSYEEFLPLETFRADGGALCRRPRTWQSRRRC
jgi:hypothetical protein